VRQEGDRLVAVKVTARPGDGDRLAHEATMLAASAHPGVVELVGLHESDGDVELVTAWVGNRSLAEVAPLPPATAAAVVASLATAVADLHDIGIVHGRLDPSHVLLDQCGRPVLCGFGDAGPLGEPRSDSRGPRRAADDVGGLGAILTTALGEVPTDGLVPERRFRARRGHHQLHRSLLVLADRASVDDLSSRPSARSLAASIHHLVPESAALPAADDADDGHAPLPRDAGGARELAPDTLEDQLERLRASAACPAPRRPRRRSRSAAAFLLTAAIGVGLTVVATTGAGEDTADPDSPSVASVHTTTGPNAQTDLSISTTTAPSSVAPVIDHGGRRYALGEPGDRAAVGDWRCDGAPTAILFRPATGEVFVFEAWADADGDVVAEAVTQLGAGAELLEPPIEGCAPPRVALGDGSIITIPLPEDP
jgi:hypothetical protein